jgi:hypothetical protein
MKQFGGLFALSIPLVEMLRAKVVLNDAQVAWELAQGQQGSFAEWRVHWTALCALLRTVGGVFFKADSEHFIDYRVREQIRRRFDELGATKPEPRIFWEFIKQERDNILHEHQFGTVKYKRRSDGSLVPMSISGAFGLGIPGAVPAPLMLNGMANFVAYLPVWNHTGRGWPGLEGSEMSAMSILPSP